MFRILRIIAIVLIIQSLFLALSGVISSAQTKGQNYLGASLKTVRARTNGGQELFVQKIIFVSDESPASDADLRKGDLIIAIGGYTPESAEKWAEEIKKIPGSETLDVRILREDTELALSIKLRPRDKIAIELAQIGGMTVLDNSWGVLATRIQSILRRNRCESATKFYAFWSYEQQGCKVCGDSEPFGCRIVSAGCQLNVERYNELTTRWNNFVYQCHVANQ
jgi:membrane-associated protease RseP (regulator of RpoE activity)